MPKIYTRVPIQVITGFTYKVTGTTGSVVYNSVTYALGSSFTGVSGFKSYTYTGDATPVNQTEVLIVGATYEVVGSGTVTYNSVGYTLGQRIVPVSGFTSYTTSGGNDTSLVEVFFFSGIELETGVDVSEAAQYLSSDTYSFKSIETEGYVHPPSEYRGDAIEVTTVDQKFSGSTFEVTTNANEFRGISFEIVLSNQKWDVFDN